MTVRAGRAGEGEPGIGIVYITNRREPRFDWFADSLAAQLPDAERAASEGVEVVCVDGLYSAARHTQMERVVADRFPFRHVPAKPSPYNGPSRLTRTEFHAPASARNTGIVYARQRYLVFVDDCCVLMPGWWREVKAAATFGYVVAGAYHFHWEMRVEDGNLVGSRLDPFRRTPTESFGTDNRWHIGDDGALVRCRGRRLYGGNFGVPRSLLLAVNGNDEICDTMGGQDIHLGLRLEWSGAPMFYSRRMLLIKSEERHDPSNTVVTRLNPEVEPAVYMETLRKFGVDRRTFEGEWRGRDLVWDILFGTGATRSLGNYYDLDQLDPGNLLGTVARFPTRYWVDDRPLAEM